MTNQQKERAFYVAFWSAGFLYLWAMAVIWMGPAWGLGGRSFYLLGVLPALAGVVALATALGLYVDLQE